MTFQKYLEDNFDSQDWLELFYVYNEQNNYGYLVFGDFEETVKNQYEDYQSLLKAFTRGSFDGIDQNASYFVVDNYGRIRSHNSQLEIVSNYASFYTLAKFAEENDLPCYQDYKDEMEL
jgi:hypothetical protein